MLGFSVTICSLFCSAPAAAAEHRWVDVLVTTTATMGGELVGGYAGALIGAQIPFRSNAGDFLVTPVADGAVLGAAAGAIGGAVGGAAAVHGDVCGVALATSVTAGVSAVGAVTGVALVNGTEETYTPGALLILGSVMGGGVLGAPMAAGLAAGIGGAPAEDLEAQGEPAPTEPSRPRATLSVAPVFTPAYRGLSLHARF